MRAGCQRLRRRRRKGAAALAEASGRVWSMPASKRGRAAREEDAASQGAPNRGRKRRADMTAAEYAALVREGDAYIRKVLAASGEQERPTLFCVISKGRSANVPWMETQLLVPTAGLPASHVLWVVGAGEKGAYEEAGARGRVVEGPSLCGSRNLAVDEAVWLGCSHVVQLSDDLKKMEVIRSGEDLRGFVDADDWVKPRTLRDQNRAGANKLEASPVAVARLLTAVMARAGAALGGAPPTANPGLACGMPPVGAAHFVVGDFTVLDLSRPPVLRWDEAITLKEDYDYTAQHLLHHGSVARSHRILCSFEHYCNPGGAVDDRSDSREQHSIALLHHKWPGAFRKHGSRGENEISFCWNKRDVSIGGTNVCERAPRPGPPPPAH